ncbi:MAG: 2,3-bisphosphoglycerate-independent phosphoglycerate mutase [Crocinitomicaceae bacterium]|nr:2,3-bisphosphoglycerate-independent phosphoglycerate mutase [Crocinitomicaceae bacterium]
MANKAALLILDGWGNGDKSVSDAIHNASTPVFDKLVQNHPTAELLTDGLNVGLPDGQMGNSEVGHMNIGAGRIVYQELTRIDKAINEGEFQKNPQILKAFEQVKNSNARLHLIGLVSDGGVHSHQNHLYELIKLAESKGIGSKTFVHGFTDGRDCNPTTGLNHFQNLDQVLSKTNVQLASVIGRYYAMDRDNRWERIKLAYDLLVHGEGAQVSSGKEVFEKSYSNDVTDEFILPHKIGAKDFGNINEGDVVICFNFRTDRCREISQVLSQEDFPEHGMNKLDIQLFTMTMYDSSFKGVEVIYEKENLTNTIGEVIADSGLTQVRIAETEKYPHVSYFFSGGLEDKFEGESRIMVPSPKVKTYDLKPEMSAPEIADKIIENVTSNEPDFICLNFANTDMVGHTGVYQAIVRAAEAVDFQLGRVVSTLKDHGYNIIIIADHGNADFAINPDGSPNTAHSLNPVPVILVSENEYCITNGILADVAPTLLKLMDVAIPADMTGKVLVS